MSSGGSGKGVGAVSHDKFRFGLVAAAYLVSILFFVRLPALVSQGVRHGVVLDFVRVTTAFTIPTAALIVVLIFRSLSRRDPLRANYERFRRTYEVSVDLAVALAIGTHLLLLSLAMILQVPFPADTSAGHWLSRVPTCLVGIVLFVAGNILPRLRPNYAMGIRTRWTLGDETVWMRTHRAAGYFLVVFGLILIVWTFIDFRKVWWILGPGAALTAVGLPMMSYLISKHKRRPSPPLSEGSAYQKGVRP
jgi:uncharacterized membrane protein